jgi:Raf kinase inhibitor-like YbhB/YbcL family protein
MMSLKLTSRAFQHEGVIPDRYSKDGGNISPPLAWTGAPDTTKSLALIMDDPDAPSDTFVHWLVYRIPPARTELNEDLPAAPQLSNGARQGRNGFGNLGYGGLGHLAGRIATSFTCTLSILKSTWKLGQAGRSWNRRSEAISSRRCN